MPPPRLRTTAIGLALLALTVACSAGPSRAPAAGATGSAATSPATTGSGPTAPLTGLPVRAIARRPALVVKIENSPVARPQSGLDRADLVVEELVEGGITRFAAMFQSRDPGVVGPVRSLRAVDAAIASPTRGLLASSGGAGVVLRALAKAPVQLMTPSDPASAYFRSAAAAAPHNLFARASALWSNADPAHSAPPPAYLPFAADAASAATSSSSPDSRPARRALLRFSPAEQPRWAYDPASGTWLRSEGTTPARVAGGARISAGNVVVLTVRTRDAGYRDPIGNPVPETVLTGSGKALVLSGGRQVSGTWRKAAAGAPLTLATTRGGALLLAPGTTWLELVPTSGSVQVR